MITQANHSTSHAEDDNGEAAFNEDAFEESEHVSDMLGDNSNPKTLLKMKAVCQIMTSVSLKMILLRRDNK